MGKALPTISSSGANAAIIHYEAKHGACAPIAPDAVYLCDTGGQFLDGTTDVTRTLHFGTPTDDERRAYTRVLQGHIDLACATFPAGTPGLMLEMLSRAPLWRDGMNFLHGTGHGIGAYLNVHEGPAGIGGGAAHIEQVSEARRRMYLMPIEEGWYLSDEPGFYLEVRRPARCPRGRRWARCSSTARRWRCRAAATGGCRRRDCSGGSASRPGLPSPGRPGRSSSG